MPKEIKGPQSFSSVAFHFLPWRGFLICEKLITLSVKSDESKRGKKKSWV